MRARIVGWSVAAAAALVGGCTGDNLEPRVALEETHRSAGDDRLQAAVDAEAAARRLAVLEALGAAKDHADATATKAATEALATAKAYTDARTAARFTETHLVVKATNKSLGRWRGGYATAAKVAGEEVTLDWATPLRLTWSAIDCSDGSGAPFLNQSEPSISLLDSVRYVTSRGTLIAFDSDAVKLPEGSSEDLSGACQPEGGTMKNGYPGTELTVATTDEGLPIRKYKPKELRLVELSVAP